MHHKIQNDPKNPLHEYLRSKEDQINKIISQEGLELLPKITNKLTKISQSLNHHLFFHTSCAISSLQQKVDFNGSMFRDDICQNSFCPNQQLKRCALHKNNWNPKDNLKTIALALKIRKEQIVDHQDCIEILNESISQEDLTFATHLVGKPVFSKAIRLSLVWPSGNQKYYWKKYGY